MKDIAIYGAGGFGKEIALMLQRINTGGEDWNFIGFFDDGKEKGFQVSHLGKVLGNIDTLNTWPTKLAVGIAVGNTEYLPHIREGINNDNIWFPNLLDPSVNIIDPESFRIGEGNIIQQNCRFSIDVTVGNFNIMNSDTVVGHDVKIGDYNVIMPDIRISGEVSIGTHCLIGVGSIILQQIKIGTGVRLAAGSVLLTKPKDNSVYMGNPAKLFKY